ncbi:hypothetical protein ACK4CS_00060 [Enterococcus gallinarum]|uniref:hypothetical protein n=1 Tax=Enterococcus TaxID=1350 RepID=UPI00100F50CD|nr:MULTISPECIES: hypothetical protein [Enterococcus]MCD5192394.1 hypothetical protein [Enterococcus casseliflavus]RXV98691.1 hypothetical protein CYQ16_05405 [Enterococcus faecalis]
MLKLITLEKIGFNNSIKLNDLFDYEEDSWIVRAISGNRIKGRYINTGGIKGFQHDLIEATVVAQKIGTFDKNNRVSSETEIISTAKMASINSLSSYEKRRTVRVGDVCELGDNEFYIAREVTEIKYSFVDVVTKLKGYSVTELTPLEIKKLKNQRRLNELGWSVC